MDLKEWVEENLLTAKKDKLSGKRINEKWMRDRGFDKQYEALIDINPDFNLACKIVVGWTGTCSMCPNIVVLPAKCCSYKCSVNSPEWKEKKRETMIERYGIENAFEKGKLRNEFEEKNLERYGVRFPIASEEVRNKAKATCLENYGVEYSLQSDVIQDKIKDTLIERYGVENPCDVPGVREKKEATNLERYGFKVPSKSEEVKEKAIQTNLEKYGVEHPAKTEWFLENKKKTNLEKYGVEYANQSHYTKGLLEAIEAGLPEVEGVNDSIFDCLSLKTKYTLIHQYRPELIKEMSMAEKELTSYLKTICEHEILENKYGILDRLELDMYIPELKLGFEFNGTYWHSTKFKTEDYHQTKSIVAKEKGITLIHLYEFDGFEKNKEIINQSINGNFEPETIIKENFIYSNFDQGSNKFLSNEFVGYELTNPVYENSDILVFGAGYEIFKL